MSHLRRARLGGRPPSDHERARQLAAIRLSEALTEPEAAWLAAHLEACPPCRTVAADYEAQQAAFQALRGVVPAPIPPRDLWARTAAALDAEARRSARAGRSRPDAPGRGLVDGRRGVGRRPAGRWPVGRERARLVPYGALAGALVVALVVASSLIGDWAGLPAGEKSVPPSAAPAPTPVAVAAEAVAWLAPLDDGTYALNVASVDRVCPTDAQPDCAPIDGSARQLIRLTSAPRAVLRSPSQAQVVVLDGATTSVGGAVYVVPVAAPDGAAAAGGSPGPGGTPFAIASAPPTPPPPEAPGASPAGGSVESLSSPSTLASPAAGRSSSPPPAPSSVTPWPSASSPGVSPGASLPVGSGGSPSPAIAPGESPLPGPTASAASASPIEIIRDVIVVGESAAYSADGTWFAFTARPADGSHGPDIYAWHVGDLLARPVTTDHASVFSSWFGGLILGSRAVPDALVVPPGGILVPGQTAPGGPGGPAPGESGTSAATPGPTSPPTPAAPSAPGLAGDSPGLDASPGPGALPSPSSSPIPTGQAVSFVLDPASGERVELPVPAWRPVLDPSGRYVVYWSGSLGFDASTSSWQPFEGQLVIAPWSWLTGGTLEPVPGPSGELTLPLPTPGPDLSPAPGESPAGPGELPSAAVGPDESPTGQTPGTTGVLDRLGRADATRPPLNPAVPTPGPTLPEPPPTNPPGPVGSAPGSGEPGAPPSGSQVEGGTGSPLPSPSATPFTPLTGPDPLLPAGPASPSGAGAAGAGPAAAVRDWDIRWDSTGTRLAIWIGDPVNPWLGRLSLLAIDGPTGRVDLARSSLLDVPALAGFSLADGRLAWATPPGQDGEGSRLSVFAWDETGAGQVDSQPTTGSGAVIVVR